jgi:hypothetical protein
MTSSFALCLALLCVLVFSLNLVSSRPSEQERVELWYAAGNTWPPNWQPETEGMKRLMEFREAEIMEIPGGDERWENWMQFTQSRLVPKFTSHGFEIIKTPDDIHAKLLAAVNNCLTNWRRLPYETDVEAIYAKLRPKFCDVGSLAWDVAADLLPLHELWAGDMRLEATSSYGVRLYQNQSSLVMHYDKVCEWWMVVGSNNAY